MNITQDQIKQITTEDSRYYHFEYEGKEYAFISVTTILGALLNKPALVPWAYNVGIEATIELLQKYPGFMEDLKTQDSSFVVEQTKKMLKEAEMSYANRRDEGADRGTLLHKAFEARAADEYTSELDIAKELYPGYVKQMDRFLDDYRPEFHENELIVISMESEYAGTLDGVCTIKKHPSRKRHESLVGKKVILDLKSNNDNRIYPEANFPQVDAYANAYWEMGGRHDQEIIVAIGPENYTVGVNYFRPGCFRKLLAAYWELEECKAMNPNKRK